MVKYILAIKGVSFDEYKEIREDLAKQYEAKGIEIPLFVHLPQDYPEIELIWIDEEMEKERFETSIREAVSDSVKARALQL